MKFITSLFGTVALHVSGDEATPEHGISNRDLIEFLASTYQFSVRPNIPPGVPPIAIPTFTFQSGIMTTADKKWPIVQLAIVADGHVVTAQNTDIADAVLDDFMARLDTTFGYRFATAKKHRAYQSNIVIQFDNAFEEKVEAMGKIEVILNREINRPAMPFKIKRLAFGYGDVEIPTISLEAIDKSDFAIERRVGAPYSESRYYSVAPARTSDHVKILEMIEQAIGG